jgi:hypothetical protein
MGEIVTTIHVTKPLTTFIILDMVEEYPNLREITCSRSVYERISKRYIAVLEGMGIEVKKKYNWGAKSQTNGLEDIVSKLKKEGLKPKEIAQELDIKLNRVYYLLRLANEKVDNRKRKHDHAEVRSLKEKGLSAKEISDKLDIPLRSVYYILNGK